ncbi:hypothetical protein Aduo_019273 [Ancylostoma duodenale]
MMRVRGSRAHRTPIRRRPHAIHDGRFAIEVERCDSIKATSASSDNTRLLASPLCSQRLFYRRRVARPNRSALVSVGTIGLTRSPLETHIISQHAWSSKNAAVRVSSVCRAGSSTLAEYSGALIIALVLSLRPI